MTAFNIQNDNNNNVGQQFTITDISERERKYT